MPTKEGPCYLDALPPELTKGIIKVLSGERRRGLSVILTLYLDYVKT